MEWTRLTEFLAGHSGEVRLTFTELESMCRGALPASKQYPAFWSNSSSYAKYWLRSGYHLSRAGCLPDELRFLKVDSGARSSEAKPATVRERLTVHPDVRTPSDGSRIILVGCVKTKRTSPSAAKDLYESPLFERRRAYAEAAGGRWFILSAEYGLLSPDEFVSPYDTYLPDMTPAYRRAWGQWCASRLDHLSGPLRGRQIEIHAGASYVEAVRGPLEAMGASVMTPLEGLPQGKQLAWYPAFDAARTSRIEPSPTALMLPGDEGTSNGAQAVADALLEYRTLHMSDNDAVPLGGDGEAGQLLTTDPFAFLVAVIFDEGIVAERAWQAPFELRRRLGHLDPARLRHQIAEVTAAVTGPPALHRYVDLIPRAICLAAARVCDEYGGDASRIWAPALRVTEVDRRLKEFNRIGQKKSAMAVEILLRKYGVDLVGIEDTDIAYDVQVRRVFLRSGIVDRDDRGEMIQAARRLMPERPGYIDLAAWHIGREWCRPQFPQCSTCPLTHVCPKHLERGR